MSLRLVAVLCALAGAVAAQDVSEAPGAVLRGLDKLTGEVNDLEVPAGRRAQLGRIQIDMMECRYPAGNPAGDAYAFLVIREAGTETPIFSGWMIASSPALNALDHPRYDVWVLRCSTS